MEKTGARIVNGFTFTSENMNVYPYSLNYLSHNSLFCKITECFLLVHVSYVLFSVFFLYYKSSSMNFLPFSPFTVFRVAYSHLAFRVYYLCSHNELHFFFSSFQGAVFISVFLPSVFFLFSFQASDQFLLSVESSVEIG